MNNEINKNKKSFWLKSYERHFQHDAYQQPELLESWKNFDTIDAWRHKRMYDTILPLIKDYPLSRWLTIGDGRYGTDANFLLRNNVNDVLASNISDVLLKKSKEAGFIKNYQVENAENLSFNDNSFDFVFCKEAYHHFPRPMIAFYEMLRVTSLALIIIEPNDVNIKTIKESQALIRPKKRFQAMKDFMKDILGKSRYEYNSYNPDDFETAGNYVYSVSEREFEKAALGLNLPVIAFKGINSYYETGVEFEIATENSAKFNKIRNFIAALDADCEKNGKPYNILASIIFKAMPQSTTLIGLERAGFRVNYLSKNPYI